MPKVTAHCRQCGTETANPSFCSRECCQLFTGGLFQSKAGPTHHLYKHGASQRLPEYKIWKAIIQRCHNPKSTAYKNYGARGIAVAGEWRGDGGFERFLAHIGQRPTAKHTIDRIDNDKGYEPGNVRWASRSEQSRNNRRNRLLTVNGKTLCLADWATETGIRLPTLKSRVRYGWTDEQIILTPVGSVWSIERAR